MNEMKVSPVSWEKVALAEISISRMGKTILAKELSSQGIPVYSAGAGSDAWGCIKESDITFGRNTLVISARGNIGAPKRPKHSIFVSTQTTIATTFFEPETVAFYQYFLSSYNFGKHSSQTTIPMLRVSDVNQIEVPVPPLNEQHRIVAKIEELFSELDKGIENLKTAREQLKVYRQALLKHAFEGKLTAQWRAANPDKLESAAALLARIQTEREQRYRQQLQQWEATGGSKPKTPKPLPPLSAEELAELPELPGGWGWFKLADLSDISGGLTKNQKRNTLPLKRPFLRVGNVYANRLELDDMHDTGIAEAELERVTLAKGDILIVEGNGSVDQIGRVAIWNGAIEGCVHQNHLIKSRPLSLARSEFVLYFLMSELGRKFIVRAASSTSGLHTLSISKVESLFVSLCASEEQNVLLSELESKLSLADQLDQTLTTSLQQSEALRQSILKKAFSGQLVAQDANDEPASALLARIRAERAVGAKNAQTAAKPRKSSTGDKLSPVEISPASMSKEP